MRSNIDSAYAQNVTLHRMKVTSAVLALAGTLQLGDEHPTALAIDAGGSARDVVLPVPSGENSGLVFMIFNTSAGATALTVKSAAATVISIGQGKAGTLVNVNGTWRGVLGA